MSVSIVGNDIAQKALQDLHDGVRTLKPAQASDLARAAETNLRRLLEDPEGPFATDPELALRAFNLLAKNEQAVVETRRRVADCIIKAKQVLLGSGNNLPAPPENFVGEPSAGAPENSAFA